MIRTKGEWIATQDESEAANKRSWMVFAKNGNRMPKTVANFTSYTIYWRRGEARHERMTKADALLCAAAPDLLAALEAALKTAAFEHHPYRPWHDEARAAIDKAKGR